MSLTQGLQLPYGIQPVINVPVDAWSGPYTAADPNSLEDTIAVANAAIPSAVRFVSMSVRLVVAGESRTFWYKHGIADADLVEFIGGNGGNQSADTYFFVSGSADGEHNAVFGGDVVITGSLSSGGGLALGLAAHADGFVFAVGERCHAEGKETAAIGYSSHSEGFSSQAIGQESHAEGAYTIAGGNPYVFNMMPGTTIITISGTGAAVELAGGDLAIIPIESPGGPKRAINITPSNYGITTTGGDTIITLNSSINGTTSTGVLCNTSKGRCSHAEGYQTQAYGEYSHTQGLGTIASGSGQFVAGTYNLHGNDTSIFVIGNGAEANRSDIVRINGSNFQVTGSLSLTGSLNISQGLNLPSGKFTLNGGYPGTATVTNTLVGINSIILLTKQTLTHPAGVVGISSRVPGTSFTITSSHNGDDDEVGYLIINP